MTRKRRSDALIQKDAKFPVTPERQEAFDTLIKIYGTQKKIGEVFGIRQQAVSNWFKGLAEMEYWRAVALEQHTKGQVKAAHLSRFSGNIDHTG